MEDATQDVDITLDNDRAKPKTLKAPATTSERVPGRSLFPVARVQKILKADKELDLVAKEAVFLVSMATERFIARIAESAKSQAGREKRSTVQRKDILTIVRREDEYFFLTEILGDNNTLRSIGAKKDGKLKSSMPTDSGQQRLDDAPLARAFATVQSKDQGSGSEEEGVEEIAELIDNAQSEAASQPPSSRPSSPLSLTGSRSEEVDPVEYEMDEDDE